MKTSIKTAIAIAYILTPFWINFLSIKLQAIIPNIKENKFVFTEQGNAMLSAVLKSDVAVEVSIKIMNSFVEMRRFLISNQELFSRLDRIELKQLETDKKLEEVFNYLATNTEVKQNIFFDGQIYDAFSFIVGLVKKAN